MNDLPEGIKRIYIAGPMRGIPYFNFPAFHEATNMLRYAGYTVLSPAEHDEETGFNPAIHTIEDLDLEDAMKWDLHAVLESDAVIVLPGWQKSQGTAHEISAARAIGIPVYEYPDMNEIPSNVTNDMSSYVPSGLTGETRIINEKTGGAKGQKLARYDLIPSDSLWALAEHFGKGAGKYADRNWERGYDWSLNFAAAQRHMWQWWNREDTDSETGSSHLIAAAWHMFALFHFATTHKELDDRP